MWLAEWSDQEDGLQNATEEAVKRREPRAKLACAGDLVEHCLRRASDPGLQVWPTRMAVANCSDSRKGPCQNGAMPIAPIPFAVRVCTKVGATWKARFNGADSGRLQSARAFVGVRCIGRGQKRDGVGGAIKRGQFVSWRLHVDHPLLLLFYRIQPTPTPIKHTLCHDGACLSRG